MIKDITKHDCLAFDRASVRETDIDGRMSINMTRISKAMVCPYEGKEIPGYQALGLNAKTVYMLLRDPVELAKAASTFNGKQLLIIHEPVHAGDPHRELTVGSTGNDAEFNAPYLEVTLNVWDAAAIAGIQSKEQTELSSAYRYRADMTPGVYEGTAYDGVMRDINGNHVALVVEGRAGPDVVVADENPFKGNLEMTKKQRLIAAKSNARKALEGKLAQDADLALLDKAIEVALDAEPDTKEKDKPAEDESDDDEDGDTDETKAEKAKRRAAKLAADAEEDEKEKKPEVTKAAMDSAIRVAVAAATKATMASMEALHTARKEVAHMVGDVAMDSAEAVYKFALDHAKVDVEGVHPSAYRALVRMAGAEKTPTPRVAMDAATGSSFAERFPTAGKPTRS